METLDFPGSFVSCDLKVGRYRGSEVMWVLKVKVNVQLQLKSEIFFSYETTGSMKAKIHVKYP